MKNYRRPNWLIFVLILQLVLLTQCSVRGRSDCIDLEHQSSEVITIEILEDNLKIQDVLSQNPEAQSAWQQKTDFFNPESEWGGWVTQLQMDTDSSFDIGRFIENPIKIPAKTQIHGLFFVRNGWKKPHDLRLIFLLDFHQMTVVDSGKVYDYYDLTTMQPQEDRVIGFKLPEIANGFHQFSILLMTDAESTSTDKVYRVLQQKSFYEGRYDLWVGIDSLPREANMFESVEMGQSAAARIGALELITSSDNASNDALTSIVLKPGEYHCFSVRLFNCGVECGKSLTVNNLYSGPVPLKVVTFWNDRLEGMYDYVLTPDAPDNLALKFGVKAPEESGIYQFNLVAFYFPGYSQFDTYLTRTSFPPGLYSQRILVEVTP